MHASMCFFHNTMVLMLCVWTADIPTLGLH